MKKNIKYILIALIFITITSKLSPIYPINDWCDTNSFFTMGKAIFNGKIIYKDLFEQKGPILYLIYGIGYLISNKTFIGVYILEIISFGFFLKIIDRVLQTLDIKNTIHYLFTISFVITTSIAFYGGGSAEEFCLPYISWNIYILIKNIKKQKISTQDQLINGICFSIVFLIKFNLVSFWIAPLIIYMMQYKKEAIKGIIYFILGSVMPILLIILYFLINHSLFEFLDVYFFKNIFEYNNIGIRTNIISKIIDGIIYMFIENFLKNIFLIITLILSFIYAKKKKMIKLYLLVTIIPFFFICCQANFFEYYILPFCVFSLFGLIELYNRFKIEKINNKTLLIILIIVTFINGKNTYMLKYKKNDYAHYDFFQIINKYEDKSVLNYGFIDTGFYLETNEVPNIRFFHTMNFSDFKEMKEEQLNYIKDKKTNFVICFTIKPEEKCNNEESINKKYKLVTIKRHNKDYGFYYHLYIRK